MRKFNVFRRGKCHMTLLAGLLTMYSASAQETFPVNGVAEPKNVVYAFVHATIVKDGQTTLNNGTLVIKGGKVLSVGADLVAPKEAIIVDCKGKYIYPSFVDIYSDYGIAAPQRAVAAGGGGGFFGQAAQLTSNTKGSYGWNQAIHPEVDAYKIFDADPAKAKSLRDIGFGTVLTHQKDGIARGTGAVVTLADAKENLVVLKERASQHFAMFNGAKGTSSQSYPSSLMGVIALLRQTYLDADWYKSKPEKEGTNISLQAMLDNKSLIQVCEANDKWNDLRADRIGDEFGVQYVIKGGGNEFERLKEIAGTKATYILNLNYPQATDVEDPSDARMVTLGTMKAWEMTPANPGEMEKAKIPFCLTSADLRDPRQFMTNLRKAIDYGLSESAAMTALTKTPATLLGIADKVGSLDAGKMANFLITSGPIFNERTVVYQNWVQGDKYVVSDMGWTEFKGLYKMTVNFPAGPKQYTLDVKSANAANVISADTITGRFSFNGKIVSLSFGNQRARGGRGGFGGGQGAPGGAAAPAAAPAGPTTRLSGIASGADWGGTGEDTAGNKISWTATYQGPGTAAPDTATRRKAPIKMGKITYPFESYGFETMPVAENMLIKNATVWTNEKEGVLQNADVLVKNGKIVQVGKNLTDASAKVIDGTGKHVTPGIIDEHSHIAAASINEGAQSVTSEVRIADNLDPDDINIYRQLSGGVTTSHILHGSANTIGGQTQLIKLRWGANDDELKFKNSDGFIKFAMGENVKRTSSQNNTRYPDTRMGVEEVFADAFSRARDYQAAWKEYETDSKKKGSTAKAPRKDLELEALVEILNNKRFITCHSYVQSEITALLRVADKYKFKVNTFTHILEGYKVADKMLAHGANASTFSDWWAYKLEVQDAIPYNAAIMTKVGLNVCINSDDAEMARRLNQEAAKSIKYGGLTEEQALKMVTLNPAIALHVADRVGSLKPGKDADLVIWSDNPLTIYAKSEKTIVDGIVYFDRARDLELRKDIALERNRLVQKLIGEKRSGSPVQQAVPTQRAALTCGDHDHEHGLFDVEEAEEELH
jgi:imidazolonepropionase-like amidohydrolase